MYLFKITYFEAKSPCIPDWPGTLDHHALKPKMLHLYMIVTTTILFAYFKFWCVHRSAQGSSVHAENGERVTWRSEDSFVESFSYPYTGSKDQTEIAKLGVKFIFLSLLFTA